MLKPSLIRFVFAGLLLGGPGCLPAQSLDSVRAELKRLGASGEFSGVVLVRKGGKTILHEAYGLASKEYNAPNRIDTRFNLASVGKMFTAVAIAQLVEAGQAQVDRHPVEGGARLSQQGPGEPHHHPPAPDPHLRHGALLGQPVQGELDRGAHGAGPGALLRERHTAVRPGLRLVLQQHRDSRCCRSSSRRFPARSTSPTCRSTSSTRWG